MDQLSTAKLEFRRKYWKLVGAEINVLDPGGDDKLVGFINVKGWRLREDIRLYTGPDMQEEIFHIGARNVIDFGGTYDVSVRSDVPRFSLRRKGLRSTFVRDHWLVLDPAGQTMGTIQETSSGLALARRWVGLIPFVGSFIDLALAFAPQSYLITDAHDRSAGVILHRKNPFIVKLELDRSGADPAADVDPYLGPAICALLSIIDADK